jgi:hypothetical protein
MICRHDPFPWYEIWPLSASLLHHMIHHLTPITPNQTSIITSVPQHHTHLPLLPLPYNIESSFSLSYCLFTSSLLKIQAIFSFLSICTQTSLGMTTKVILTPTLLAMASTSCKILRVSPLKVIVTPNNHYLFDSDPHSPLYLVWSTLILTAIVSLILIHMAHSITFFLLWPLTLGYFTDMIYRFLFFSLISVSLGVVLLLLAKYSTVYCLCYCSCGIRVLKFETCAIAIIFKLWQPCRFIIFDEEFMSCLFHDWCSFPLSHYFGFSNSSQHLQC